MNKGIFKTLRFFIIICAIIVVGVFIAQKGFKMLRLKENDDIKTDLLLIQAKVKVIKGKSDVSANTEAYVGTKVSESDNGDMKDFLKNINIQEPDFEKYYILSNQDFEAMEILGELKNPEENSFVVNYDDAEVIYKNGVETESGTKYKVSEIVVKENPKFWVLYNRVEVDKWKKKNWKL